jgi:hypothetical protein
MLFVVPSSLIGGLLASPSGTEESVDEIMPSE